MVDTKDIINDLTQANHECTLEIQGLEAKNIELTNVLNRLLAAKREKEINGKTEKYEQMKLDAWESAKYVLMVKG